MAATCQELPTATLLTWLGFKVVTCAILTLFLINCLLATVLYIVIGVHCVKLALTETSAGVTGEVFSIRVLPSRLIADSTSEALFVFSAALSQTLSKSDKYEKKLPVIGHGLAESKIDEGPTKPRTPRRDSSLDSSLARANEARKTALNFMILANQND